MTEPPTFRERMVPPWWWHPAFLAWCTLLTTLAGVGETWIGAVAYAAIPTLLVSAGGALLVLEVRDGAIVRGRRHRVPLDDILTREVVRGRALRAARRRTIPQQRHAPVWHRTAVRVVADEGSGPLEWLYGVRDLDGFLRATGVDPARVPRVQAEGTR